MQLRHANKGIVVFGYLKEGWLLISLLFCFIHDFSDTFISANHLVRSVKCDPQSLILFHYLTEVNAFHMSSISTNLFFVNW